RNVSGLSRQFKIQDEQFWEKRGQRMTMGLFRAMARRVPAYKDFLKKNNIEHEKIRTLKDFKKIPTIDKENYLRQYSLDALSWDGVLNTRRSSFAATSGSTGEPFYFPRQRQHDLVYSMIAELYLRENFSIHTKKTLYVNCFALGIWIGGLFTYEAITSIMQRQKYDLSIINPGMDKKKAIASIQAIGSHYDQVIIGGYPPLVKDLIDEGISKGLAWSDYSIGFIFSAEGFSEEFRDYVLSKAGVEEVYTSSLNHYGTVDLGTMSHETPLCILLRREMAANEVFFKKFFGQTAKLPTLTQYIPELFYFQQEGDALVCSSNAGIPMVRYDLKDRGGICTLSSARQIAKEHNVDISRKSIDTNIESSVWNLPFVYVYERSDFSVSLYGANIYPESIRKVLEKGSYTRLLTGKFSMCIKFDSSQNQYLEINVECKKGIVWKKIDERKLSQEISKNLVHENSEYHNNLKELGNRVIPQVVSWPNEHQKYFDNKGKQKWIIK
ncbi:MAG: hypothetical protein ABII02_01375, partial [Candidatus Magasanikbacteria bacterium]